MSSKLTISGFCISLFLLACAGTESDPRDTASTLDLDLPEELADFAEFYARFHADSMFQVQHISWPLEGKSDASAASFAGAERWQPEEWLMHRPLDLGHEFVREVEVVAGAVVLEVIRARAGNYTIVRRFARLGDEWNLIYYRVSALG